jgi:hypothetical protein
VSKESGIVEIPRFRRHCLGRGLTSVSSISQYLLNVPILNTSTVPGEGEWDLDLVVQEWTSPLDGQKEIFFRNLAGVISEPKPAWVWGWVWGLWIELQIWVVGGELDNYPAVFGGRWGKGTLALEWVIVRAMCLGAGILGGMVGLRGVYEEYTPVELRNGKERKGK